MKSLPILCFVTAVSLSAVAQAPSVDSLIQMLKGPLHDTLRINIRSQLINEYDQTSPDSAIKSADEIFQASKSANFTRGMAISLIHQGRGYAEKGDYLKALDFLLKSLSYSGYYDAEKTTALTYIEVAKVYSYFHNILHTDEVLRNVLLYNQKAIGMLGKLRHNKDRDLPLILAGVHLDVGRAYLGFRNTSSAHFDSASFHLRMALRGFQQSGLSYLTASVYQDISMMFVYRKKYDSALIMSRKALASFQKEELPTYLPFSYNHIARIHGLMDNYDSAHWFVDHSINLQMSSLDQQFLSNSYEVKGEAYLGEGKYKQAIEYFQRELQLAKQQGDLLGQEVAYNSLTECYKNLKDYQNAFRYFELVMHRRDSLTTEQDAARMENLQALFQSSEKQKEIELLAKQAEITEELLKRNQFIALAVGSFLVMAIGAIFVIVRQNRKIKKSEKEQAKLFAELDRMKSRFFANISHEFRTPLTLMLTPLEKRIEQSQTEEDRDEWLMMQNNGNRLLSLVNQLLDLSKIEAGKMTLHLERIDLMEWLKPLAGQFASIAESHSINFHVRLSEDLLWPVDRDKLEQVTLNLLSNAFKFTHDGGTIELTVSQQGDNVHIVIRDSGIGIPADQVSRVFDRFYQVDDSLVREYEGSGIGLALANELVQLHGGKIDVSSEYGRGSTFTVVLPDHPEVKQVHELNAGRLKPLRDTNTATMPEILDLESDARPCILVVEDNADLRKYMTTELGKRYRVLLAANGQEGVEQAQLIPDLIISDLMMPKVDGLELCRQIKSGEKTSHIPVILLTAKADQQIKTEGLQTGADDYMPKPFHLTELLARVQNLIDSRKRLRKLFAAQISLKPSDIRGQSLEERFMKKVLEAIELNLSNPLFGVEQLADSVAMSSVQLYRKLKATTGKTPNEVVREVRLERAAAMLQQQMGTVAEIAYQVGFNNMSYFSKCFKEQFASTPSDFSKRNKTGH
jgi:signal transduction histidine kinase/DNA-binding response OmpR family regulator